MLTNVQCPKCREYVEFETDTGLAQAGETWHDVWECDECKAVFVVRTTISMMTEVLTINEPNA